MSLCATELYATYAFYFFKQKSKNHFMQKINEIETKECIHSETNIIVTSHTVPSLGWYVQPALRLSNYC